MNAKKMLTHLRQSRRDGGVGWGAMFNNIVDTKYKPASADSKYLKYIQFITLL
jgi:hypothetical protein